ncbi:hypothetical protein [Clostridium coskatii]|uniref:Uncharacterized protein n=1 Tax=Clostridium coskatii TaxID=1705578 RepID=A0A162JFQ1_9CLOT|nr:hypothetical protein [Clostridium coskatii]OAA94465.1 hypothetical protein WX73_03011 [Clostridium coskatii]OBR93209.1 hypothetical protein CLCOS_26810 [Clostridium coskatii]
MKWEIVKRQTKTGMYISTIKSFEFDKESKGELYDKALKYAEHKNKMSFIKKYYYQVEFNWK